MPEARILGIYEKGWVSGLVDGEGSISVVWGKGRRGQRPNISPCIRMTITNNSKEILEKAKEVLGVGTIHEKKSKRRSESNRKKGWTYQNSNQVTLPQVLSQIQLIIKEEIRLLALELMNLKQPGRKRWNGLDPETRGRVISIANKICSLNGKKEVCHS